MKRQRNRYLMKLLLCLVLSVVFLKADIRVMAKDKDLGSGVARVAYISSDDQLVLRFVPFSQTGYKYTVSGNGKTLTGTLGKDAVSLNVSIKSIFAAKGKYTLKLTAQDSEDFITEHYYTGAGIQSASVSSSNKDISSNWKLNTSKIKNDYSGFFWAICNKSGSLQKKLSKFANSGKATSIKGTGTFEAGEYTSYIVGFKSVNNINYYGYGIPKKLVYVPKPPKVVGLSGAVGSGKVNLSWAASKGASGYYVYYQKPGESQYKKVKTVNGTSCVVNNLTSGKKYTFKVSAYTAVGSKKSVGAKSAPKAFNIPVVPGKVTGAFFTINNSRLELFARWNPTKGATAYEVYAKQSGESSYKLLGQTQGTVYKLSDMDQNKSLSVIIYARNSAYRSDKHSAAITCVPSTFIKKNKTRLLAKMVRTINYAAKSKGYTTKHYSQMVKEAYVNYNGFTSKTKYFIWASLYTQQATIFKGSKGKWKMIRTFTIGSGSSKSITPRGTFKIFQKDKVWNRSWGKTMYCSHFYKKNSFHTRPLYKNGKVKDATMGKPWTHGCIRCYNEDAIYIYKKIPMGTGVRVW